MSALLKEIESKVNGLAPTERAELAHELISSLDEAGDDAIESEWNSEIIRRVEEIKSGKAVGKKAMEVLAAIETRFS